MEKEKIIELADAFMQEAFQANCYMDLGTKHLAKIIRLA